MEKNRFLLLLICVSVLIASGIVGYSVIYSSKIIAATIRDKQMTSPQPRLNEPRWPNIPMPQAKDLEPGSKVVPGVTAGHNEVMGNKNAKVLMVEFSDFQCPFSKRFYQGVFPQIEKEYIKNGKVKFAYRNFPLAFHSQARPAAIACECAGEQDKYWQMFDKLSKGDSLETADLKKYAKEIGLDMGSFEACLTGEKTKTLIDSDMSDAQKLGVQGTPAFFINGRLVEGSMPFETFKKIIDEELSK